MNFQWPLLLLLSSSLLLTPACTRASTDPEGTVTVLRVIDGDTIEVQDAAGSRARVRYIGMDTPETSQPVQCFGLEARQKNRELVEGKQVRLERDTSDTDQFGRWLRYVYVGETFINGELVRGGYAAAVRYPPDTKQQETLAQLEQEARAAGRGVWGPACANAPNRRDRFK